MEDHLLEIFGGHDTRDVVNQTLTSEETVEWTRDALSELQKIPGFVRGKIKRNTEKFAQSHDLKTITIETMYAAKEAISK